MKKRHATARWAITTILLLGAVLRLGAFQEALVGADQASILAAAADIVDLRDLPGVGIKSSVGVMQTATVAYLAALPLLLVRRVIAVRWFFSVLDILALACLFRAVRRSIGTSAALIAALLYATNPWVIEFNRWIWYQTLIPTFATFAFAALLTALEPRAAAQARSRTRLGVPLAMASAALMGLVHLAAIPWAAVLQLVAFGVALRRRWWRSWLFGIGLCLLIAAPYLAFLARGGVADLGIMLGGEPPTASTTKWNTATYQLTLELLSGRQIMTAPHNPLWADSVLWWDGATQVLPAILLVSIVWALLHLGTRRRRLSTQTGLALAVGWTLLAPTLFVRSNVHLQYFYLLFVFPAPFVLIGAAVGAWLTRSRDWRRIAAMIVTVALVLLAVWWSTLWGVRIGLEQQGKLRAPTRAWLMDATTDTIGAYLNTHPTGEVIILTHFDAGGLSPFDWIRNFLNTDRVRVVQSDGGLIIPAAETCYMLGDRADAQSLAPLGSRAVPQPQMTIPAASPWTFTCVGPRPDLPPVQATWENGLSLLAAEINGEFAAGGQLALAITWHYSVVADEEYHLFNHLLRDGQLVAQVDGEGIPNRYWRDDDVLITEFPLQLPAEMPSGEYTLRVGSYTWPKLVRTLLVDGGDGYQIERWDYISPSP